VTSIIPTLALLPVHTLFSLRAAVLMSVTVYWCMFFLCLLRYFVSNRVNISHLLWVCGYWRRRRDLDRIKHSTDTVDGNSQIYVEGGRYFQGDVVRVVLDRVGKPVTELQLRQAAVVNISSSAPTDAASFQEHYFELLSSSAMPLQRPSLMVSDEFVINRILYGLFGCDFGESVRERIPLL
jgi:hypothetical protein